MEKGCLGNAIRSARLKANITQEDLSEKLGISVTHLNISSQSIVSRQFLYL